MKRKSEMFLSEADATTHGRPNMKLHYYITDAISLIGIFAIALAMLAL